MTAIGMAIIGSGFAYLIFQDLSEGSEVSQTVATVTTLSGCQVITSNGSYQLAGPVSSTGTCFSIRGSNVTDVTFDGNGQTITAGGDALEVADYGSGAPSYVTVSNFTSSAGVRTYGDLIHHVTFQNLRVGGIEVWGSDDVTIQNNIISGGMHIDDLSSGCQSDAVCTWWGNALRPTVTGNTITGSSARLVIIRNYGDAAHPCPADTATITNNTITNTIASDTDNPVTVYLACAQNSHFDNNTVVATANSQGVFARDGWSNNTFSNNAIRINYGVSDTRAGLGVITGNEGAAFKGYSSNNLFSGNTIIADHARALMLQAPANGNTFQDNILVSNSPKGIQYGPGDGAGGTVTRFFHNTIVNRGSGGIFAASGLQNTTFQDNIFDLGGATAITGTSPRTNFVANHNLYHSRAGAVAFENIGNFAAWQSATGDTPAYEADPLFVNYATGDYHLQSGSPAKGAGTSGSNLGAATFLAGPACVENWSCSAWGDCSNSLQTRTCTDLNSCGTVASRPPLSQSCITIRQGPARRLF